MVDLAEAEEAAAACRRDMDAWIADLEAAAVAVLSTYGKES